MNALLRDLLGHQAWADAELWRAIRSHAPARSDTTIRGRLHHIHQVQTFFIWAVGDRATPATATRSDDYATFDALLQYGRESLAAVDAYVSRTPDARFEETIRLPWFNDPPLSLTVAEALTQMAMHTQHHRGQNAARLRDLGGEPPMLDLIVWYWRGRPKPVW